MFAQKRKNEQPPHWWPNFDNSTLRRFIGSSSTTFSAQLTACLRDLPRHFKTDPTETVAFCFGIPEKTLSR
jgi:hypothetical protein